MAAALQSHLQPPQSRALAALWRSASLAPASASSRGRWSGRSPPPPLPPPTIAAAARAAVVCLSAGPASQAAEPQPDRQEPKKPFSWMGFLQAVAVALLSPILFPLYILLVDPPAPEEAPRPKSKPLLPANVVHMVFHLVALFALMEGAEVLGRFTGPAWAESAANTLLGNGRVGEVLTACSMLSVPRSPAMQFCSICAIYCYYRCVYHFEAWHAARYAEQPGAERSAQGDAVDRAADRISRRLFSPRFRAVCWVFMLVAGPNKWTFNWLRNQLARFGIFVL